METEFQYEKLDNVEDETTRNEMYYISSDGKEKSNRKVISYIDMSNYWAMCFEEEYEE